MAESTRTPIPAIDWDLAVRTGTRLVRPGPRVGHRVAAEAVAELGECARRAEPLVREVTRLDAPTDSAVLVVDRTNWLQANVDLFAEMLGQGDRPRPERSTRAGMTFTSTGLEVGSLLAWMSAKVLGQYDPVGRRLLLVAPNVVEVERKLQLDPTNFRLWVCLHEETHRVQFGANPWLVDHLLALVRSLVGAMDLASPTVGDLVAGLRAGDPKGLLAAVSDSATSGPVLDQITALMSLLEGHADVMMDRVGPEVIGTVEVIRRRFEERRNKPGLDRVIRTALGMDAKLAQYRDGAKFCTAVIDRVGVAGFNRVFEGPGSLPSLAEIHDPQAWVERMGLAQDHAEGRGAGPEQRPEDRLEESPEDLAEKSGDGPA